MARRSVFRLRILHVSVTFVSSFRTACAPVMGRGMVLPVDEMNESGGRT